MGCEGPHLHLLRRLRLQKAEALRRQGRGPVREDSHQEVLRHPQEGLGGDLQAPDQQVLREVHQRVPLPRGEAELPHRARPKKAKKYIYNKGCKPVVRQVCENREGKKLRPVCDKIQKSVCSYKPEEKCEEEQKEYCFKVEKKVWKKVCTPEKKLIVDDTFSYV